MALSGGSRERVKHAFEPIALAMGRAGLTPDALTLIGFAITMVGAVLLSQQLWLAGGVIVFAGGAFDMFDGSLARATGRVSRLGAFMDSVFDRWGEALVYLGIVVGCSLAGFVEGAYFAAAAMGAAFMVSYTRAKAEGLGFTTGTGMAAIGIMPREVRLVVLAIGLSLAGLLGGVDDPLRAGRIPLLIALAVIASGATITTIQRIVHVRAQASRQPIQPQPGTTGE